MSSSLDDNIFQGYSTIVALLVSFGCFLLTSICFHSKNKLAYWSKLGVPGPKPWLLLGNLVQLIVNDTRYLQIEWAKQYGKFYGIYQGNSPSLVIADADLVRQVCIQHSDVFEDHDFGADLGNKYMKNFIFILKGKKWKRVRTIMTPTFTSGKIKRMYKLMLGCADELIDCCKDTLIIAKGGIINIKDTFSLYTLDVIASSCYSLKLDRGKCVNLEQVSKRNSIAKTALNFFKFRLFRFLVAFLVPKEVLKALEFSVVPDDEFANIVGKLQLMINQRRNTPNANTKAEDYLQLLIDAAMKSESQQDNDKSDELMNQVENHHVDTAIPTNNNNSKFIINEDNMQKRLTDMEIISNASILMMVGVEGTGNLLTTATYILAFHPDIQERLYAKLKLIASIDGHNNPSFSYENLTLCQYLDSVISETLRFMGPVAFLDRVANRDFYWKKLNLTIVKGQRVVASVHSIHHDERHWPQPEKFDPTRFMPDQRHNIKPCSYLPFGAGPRHCIGMRFALTEAKLGLAKLVMKYKIEPAPRAPFPPEMKLHIGLVSLKSPDVKLIDRYL